MKIIIIGGGKTVYFLAKQLISQDHRVTIVIRDPDEGQKLSHQLKATIVLGEGSDPDLLEQAGARSADLLLSLSSQDHENLVACQIAREKYAVPKTIALVNDPENEDIFRQLGVPLIFSATRIITGLLEEQAGFMAITNLMAFAQGQVRVSEIRIPDKAPVLGKSLEEVRLPEGFLIASIIRDGEVFVPRGPTVLQAHDQIILIGHAENYDAVLRMLAGE